MTTNLISQVSPINTGGLTKAAKTDVKANDTTFSDMLSASAGTDSKTADTKTDTKTDTKQNTSSKADETKADESAKPKKIEKAEKKDVAKDTDKVSKEAAEEISSQIVNAVANELNVSPEELAATLDELGLEAVDLLDNTVIPVVVVKLNGTDDMLAVATDENLYKSVVDVSNLVNEIKGDIDITDGKFDSFVDGVKEAMAENTSVNIDRELTKGDEGDASQTGAGAENFANQILDNIREAVEARGDEPVSYTTSTEEIYNQIEQSLKINLTKEVTELEINLHPASLGNVRINLASKDGMITANFITQNEAVKAAVEAQLVELKQNFEEQGIKVNEVEVMVASHAFDENLSQNSGANANTEENNSSRRRRSINLNEITEDAELEVNEEIELAREMMAANGNTVDYMA